MDQNNDPSVVQQILLLLMLIVGGIFIWLCMCLTYIAVHDLHNLDPWIYSQDPTSSNYGVVSEKPVKAHQRSIP